MGSTVSRRLPRRAEQVGSLLRPAVLLKAREDHGAGHVSAAELREIEDQAIREAVAMQEEVGLQSITDGEFRRRVYHDFYSRGLGGVKVGTKAGEGWDYTDRSGHKIPALLPEVFGRITWSKPINVDGFKFVRALTSRSVKVTLPSPALLHFRAGPENISRAAYPDLDLFWADVIEAFRKELQALGDAGCDYVQIDETAIAKFSDPHIQVRLSARGENWRDLLKLYTDAINRAIADRPAAMHVGIHLCRGNQRGHWQSEGGYDLIADTLFNQTNVDSYFLEYDSARAGSFEPLRLLPKEKIAVLGLISTKDAQLESAESIKRRIDEASRYTALDNLALSPQCGFASDMRGNPLTPERQREKLALVVEVAREVWGS